MDNVYLKKISFSWYSVPSPFSLHQLGILLIHRDKGSLVSLKIALWGFRFHVPVLWDHPNHQGGLLIMICPQIPPSTILLFHMELCSSDQENRPLWYNPPTPAAWTRTPPAQAVLTRAVYQFNKRLQEEHIQVGLACFLGRNICLIFPLSPFSSLDQLN